MIEALKDDALVKRVGGQFRLSALVQRRLGELIEGSRPLVDTRGRTMVEVAVQEIYEDKIAIDYDTTESLSPPDAASLQEIHSEDTGEEQLT